MDLLFIIHLLLTFTLLTIPFWSIDYLKYGVYIPLILSTIWIIFNGCPFTMFHEIDSSSFSQDLIQYFIPEASNKFTEHINTFILVAITVIGFHRINNNKIETN